MTGAAPGTDIVLNDERMDSGRRFANKLWNAARFIFLNMERCGIETWAPCQFPSGEPQLTVGGVVSTWTVTWVDDWLPTLSVAVTVKVETPEAVSGTLIDEPFTVVGAVAWAPVAE